MFYVGLFMILAAFVMIFVTPHIFKGLKEKLYEVIFVLASIVFLLGIFFALLDS